MFVGIAFGASTLCAACGLFPDFGGLSSDASLIDSSLIDSSAESGPSDAGAYGDVRIPCQARPCLPQSGERCCWFSKTTDQCLGPDQPCNGEATFNCFGTIQCLAVGKTACCLTVADAAPVTTCTDVDSCAKASGAVICDRPFDASFGDPTDNQCPSGLSCSGLTKIVGYDWRKCQ